VILCLLLSIFGWHDDPQQFLGTEDGLKPKGAPPKKKGFKGQKKTSTGQRRAYLLTNPGKLQRSHHSLTIKCFGGIRSWAFTEAIDYIDLVVELGFNPMWIYIS
jgi:hypothetical protein